MTDPNDTDQSNSTDINTEPPTDSDAPGDREDCLDPADVPILSWEISPYRRYCDGGTTALAVALLNYQKQHGEGEQLGSPADHIAEFHCPTCGCDVRGVYRDETHHCPRCGTEPTVETRNADPTNPKQTTPSNVLD